MSETGPKGGRVWSAGSPGEVTVKAPRAQESRAPLDGLCVGSWAVEGSLGARRGLRAGSWVSMEGGRRSRIGGGEEMGREEERAEGRTGREEGGGGG